ncbi:hypothetical protein DUNSADRAFT_15794 [Dunaliella salina]|uniref:Serine aminopeptidase S33 domain-containing protein n=1 Tax=Dunaliella salina TaxID=3046 RepID=A0ABQ7H1G3_DUNSA|nr:hypothetical protein DUNSADRAFT_15794 [Dunaliella salina]|eukprot:KAF5840699.1 hypothetical protein DUNSADRAFT_15794 [Dunaliella salina]
MQGMVHSQNLNKLREAAPVPSFPGVGSRPQRSSRRRCNVKPLNGLARGSRLATSAAAAAASESSPESIPGLAVQPNPSSTQLVATKSVTIAPSFQGLKVLHIPPAENMSVDPDYEEFVSLPQDQKPFVLMLPDMDGIVPGTTSSTASSKSKWDKFALATDLHALEMDVSFEGSFSDLVSFVKGHLEHLLPNAPPERPVYLMGEGFGGVLALAVALESALVNRLVLVNPSTSYMRSSTRTLGLLLAELPPSWYSTPAPFLLAPAIAPPPDRLLPMLMEQLRGGAPLEAVTNTRKFVEWTVDQLQQKSGSLPPATLRWRLAVLDDGVRCGHRSGLRGVGAGGRRGTAGRGGGSRPPLRGGLQEEGGGGVSSTWVCRSNLGKGVRGGGWFHVCRAMDLGCSVWVSVP